MSDGTDTRAVIETESERGTARSIDDESTGRSTDETSTSHAAGSLSGITNGIHGAVKSAYLGLQRALSDNRLLEYKWFLEQEVDTWNHWVSVPLRRRLWLWKRGFTSPCDVLYDLDTHGPDAYLSELQIHRLYKSLNGNHRYLIDDKLSQYWMLNDYPEHRPAGFGFVDRGYVHGVAGTEFDGDPVPVSDWLPEKVRTESRLVLKQLRGLGGNEVLVCEHDADGFILDGERLTEAAMCEAVERLSGYIVTEHVSQHAYADDLYPHATNTIRLLTLWDDETGELHVPIAIQRIGTEKSRPVDNYSQGGLTAEIDLETGEIGPGAQKPLSGEVPWYSTHPDTGSRIEGATVPQWDEILSTVERLARKNTNIPAIGWDILMNESGDPVVLEANTGTDIDLLQVHRPLLADPRVADIVSRHLPEVDGKTIRR